MGSFGNRGYCVSVHSSLCLCLVRFSKYIAARNGNVSNDCCSCYIIHCECEYAFCRFFVSADSSVTITEFNPANATVVSGISFPVILTFSENIQMGEGSIIFRNDFGDIEKVASNSTGFVLGEKNVTVTPGFELIYGSSYSIYFEDTPVLDMSGEPVSLLEGVYMFTIASTVFGVVADG